MSAAERVKRSAAVFLLPSTKFIWRSRRVSLALCEPIWPQIISPPIMTIGGRGFEPRRRIISPQETSWPWITNRQRRPYSEPKEICNAPRRCRALDLGMNLTEIEDYLDWIDATRATSVAHSNPGWFAGLLESVKIWLFSHKRLSPNPTPSARSQPTPPSNRS